MNEFIKTNAKLLGLIIAVPILSCAMFFGLDAVRKPREIPQQVTAQVITQERTIIVTSVVTQLVIREVTPTYTSTAINTATNTTTSTATTTNTATVTDIPTDTATATDIPTVLPTKAYVAPTRRAIVATPRAATIICNDGYVWPSTVRQGACHGHKGIRK